MIVKKALYFPPFNRRFFQIEIHGQGIFVAVLVGGGYLQRISSGGLGGRYGLHPEFKILPRTLSRINRFARAEFRRRAAQARLGDVGA